MDLKSDDCNLWFIKNLREADRELLFDLIEDDKKDK